MRRAAQIGRRRLARVLIKSIGEGGLLNVRFAPESGHRTTQQACPLSANRVLTRCSKKAPLFDHLVGASEQHRRHFEKMTMLSFGGIDVSKDRLDVMVLPEEQSSPVSNDAAGWAELVEQLRRSSIAAIGLEASGGYERGAMRALLAAGMPVRQISPLKLRQFAPACLTISIVAAGHVF